MRLIGTIFAEGYLNFFDLKDDHVLVYHEAHEQISPDPLTGIDAGGAGPHTYWQNAGSLAVDLTIQNRDYAVKRTEKVSTNDPILYAYLDGENNPRHVVAAGGTYSWGPGSTAVDLTAFRSTSTAGGGSATPVMQWSGGQQFAGGDIQIMYGTGAPSGTPSGSWGTSESAVLYFRSDGGSGTTLYLYEMGSGWKAL